MELADKLKKLVEDCGGGEPIPEWCVHTGKCSCAQAMALIHELGEASKEARQAAVAFDDCKTRHAQLVAEVEACERKLEALKPRLEEQ